MNRDLKGIENKNKEYRELLLIEILDEIRKSLNRIERQIKKDK